MFEKWVQNLALSHPDQALGMGRGCQTPTSPAPGERRHGPPADVRAFKGHAAFHRVPERWES